MSQEDQPQAQIRIKTYRLARDRFGAKELTRMLPEGATVGYLLTELAGEYDIEPDDFLVMKNGRNVKQLEGRETGLADGDDVTLSIGSLSE